MQAQLRGLRGYWDTRIPSTFACSEHSQASRRHIGSSCVCKRRMPGDPVDAASSALHDQLGPGHTCTGSRGADSWCRSRGGRRSQPCAVDTASRHWTSTGRRPSFCDTRLRPWKEVMRRDLAFVVSVGSKFCYSTDINSQKAEWALPQTAGVRQGWETTLIRSDNGVGSRQLGRQARAYGHGL
jgi:hypothetical protein